MKIKRFKKFIKESISGTEVPTNPNFSYFGPSYGPPKSPNTINYHDTETILCDIDNKFYNIDDYNDMYQEYLKTPEGSKKPLNGFNQENIIAILQVINPELF